MRRLLAALAFSALAACSGIGGELGQRIEGIWVGNSNGQSVTMTLVQSSGVTGIATIGTGSSSRSLSVSGTFVSPTLAATLSGGAAADTIRLDATVTGKAMVGTLSGSGFNGNAIALQRQ